MGIYRQNFTGCPKPKPPARRGVPTLCTQPPPSGSERAPHFSLHDRGARVIPAETMKKRIPRRPGVQPNVWDMPSATGPAAQNVLYEMAS